MIVGRVKVTTMQQPKGTHLLEPIQRGEHGGAEAEKNLVIVGLKGDS